MHALRGFAWLLALQAAGEVISRALHLPLPGPVIGMMLLLIALRWSVVRSPVAECAQFLLSHLSLLFIPVGVGVMTHLNLLSAYGGRIMLVIALSTWAGMAATLWALRLGRDDGDE
ncbi:CidA/LrgA family protein [Alcaligenaceae bacterium C4P045]|nr:CidA/LrgA family protein [Alcaligenaceae bacterium C4P045]